MEVLRINIFGSQEKVEGLGLGSRGKGFQALALLGGRISDLGLKSNS